MISEVEQRLVRIAATWRQLHTLINTSNSQETQHQPQREHVETLAAQLRAHFEENQALIQQLRPEENLDPVVIQTQYHEAARNYQLAVHQVSMWHQQMGRQLGVLLPDRPHQLTLQQQRTRRQTLAPPSPE